MLTFCFSFRYRTDYQLASKGKFETWKKDLEENMVWIKERENELESMDDLESSLIMLEEAATKIEV